MGYGFQGPPKADFSDQVYQPARVGAADEMAPAALINPLDHYSQSGWHEGRDPSVGFDTTAYLAAYADVAAAGINPLTHYLQFGAYEARSPFADGTWG